MRKHLQSLSDGSEAAQGGIRERLKELTFRDPVGAATRLASLSGTDNSAECLSRVVLALSEMAEADELLVDFERFVQRTQNRTELYQFLIDHPRAVEMLVKLFAGSRYLTETLLRNPSAIRELIQHRLLADLKSREEFIENALRVAQTESALSDKLDWSREDIQDEAVFNRVLWMALKGEQRPMPKPSRMSQLELIRAR